MGKRRIGFNKPYDGLLSVAHVSSFTYNINIGLNYKFKQKNIGRELKLKYFISTYFAITYCEEFYNTERIL